MSTCKLECSLLAISIVKCLILVVEMRVYDSIRLLMIIFLCFDAHFIQMVDSHNDQCCESLFFSYAIVYKQLLRIVLVEMNLMHFWIWSSSSYSRDYFVVDFEFF